MEMYHHRLYLLQMSLDNILIFFGNPECISPPSPTLQYGKIFFLADIPLFLLLIFYIHSVSGGGYLSTTTRGPTENSIQNINPYVCGNESFTVTIFAANEYGKGENVSVTVNMAVGSLLLAVIV